MWILIACILMATINKHTPGIIDLNQETSSEDWQIMDDVVMGGKSNGNFKINSEGHGDFFGHVSLDNNGGFSSVRHRTNNMSVKSYTKVSIRIKGDGKNYQFRIKEDIGSSYTYVQSFETSGEWQTIVIQLNDMYPSYRGQKLRKANFHHDQIDQIAFLIANKKDQDFRLIIDKITFIE